MVNCGQATLAVFGSHLTEMRSPLDDKLLSGHATDLFATGGCCEKRVNDKTRIHVGNVRRESAIELLKYVAAVKDK